MKLPGKIIRRVTNGLLGTIVGVETSRKVASLTFDDGPHPIYTPRLLKILRKYRARATFFMLGEMAQRYPNIVRQVAEEGHEIGNHTWNHPSMPHIRHADRKGQLEACAAVTKPYCTKIFRPPYGHQNLRSRIDSAMLGYKVVGWTSHVEDWQVQDSDVLADRIFKKIQRGNILLLHDAIYESFEAQAADRTFLLNAIEKCLDRMGGEIDLVSISELLQQGKPRRKYWYRQGDSMWVRSVVMRLPNFYLGQEDRSVGWH